TAGELYAPITGFYSLVYGRTNLEESFNSYLAARSPDLLATNLWDQLLGKPKHGADAVTTIDADLQRIAARELGGRPGAVAAIDPKTGDVLVLVTAPSYDPNDLSSHDPKAVRQAWSRYNRDPQKPMVSKANQELYPPGSTFKLVTASAALQNGYGPDSKWPNPPVLDLPQSSSTLANFGGAHCNGGSSTITLQQAFVQSCNVTFGEIGLELGAKELNAQAEAYGFNQDIPFQVPLVAGNFPEPSYFDEREPAVALSAIGQDEVSANPMQMAMVAAAIANGGVQMQPRLVSAIVDPAGREIEGAAPSPVVLGRPISSRTASQLTSMMVEVVASGTGTSAQIPGVSVAGKTGTAQHGTGQDPHAWFVGFAPSQDPQIAVVVVVLDGGDLGREATGGAVAAPIAKAVMQAALEKKP
ncbi:MAG: penicillin-binding protein 2, partial [Actinobacteria bacterium]|nr:penicillin-binding protein 2 [Actinomycetota bacterium]